jgi:hypothetical protein
MAPTLAGDLGIAGRSFLAASLGRRAGDAHDVPLGVDEAADREVPRRRLGPQQTLPAEALGLLERGLYVGYADVEKDPGLVPLATADPAVDAGRGRVHEAVRPRLRDLLGGRVARLELPVEQLAVVTAEPRGSLE